MNKPVILLSEHLSNEAADWLDERSTLIQVPYLDPEFKAALANAEGLIVRTYTSVDRALLNHAHRLRVVGRAGAGLDNIDVAGCRDRGVEVVHTPDANTQAVVEYVLCLICDAVRPRPVLNTALDSAQWNAVRQATLARRELADSTLGILGLGRVGRRLAQVAKPLFSRVVYHDLVPIPREDRHGAEPVSAEVLFTEADVLSIHIDGRANNRGFVGNRLISRMKHDSVMINTSRGFVVDSLALASFLRDHPGSQAMLDVHEPEPFGNDYPLLDVPNARLFPHIASRTTRAMKNMSWVVRDVMAVLEGRTPQFPAPPP